MFKNLISGLRSSPALREEINTQLIGSPVLFRKVEGGGTVMLRIDDHVKNLPIQEVVTLLTEVEVHLDRARSRLHHLARVVDGSETKWSDHEVTDPFEES